MFKLCYLTPGTPIKLPDEENAGDALDPGGGGSSEEEKNKKNNTNNEDCFHEEYRRLVSSSDQPLLNKINAKNLVIRLELCQKVDKQVASRQSSAASSNKIDSTDTF